jgi:two-component system, cell cycle sensor histidine kinase and response regulator CckA
MTRNNVAEIGQHRLTSERSIAVLHLEDNPADAQLCLYKLRSEDLNVKVDNARTGKEFRQKIESAAYDLILGDYRLPDWSGLDAVHWLRTSNVNTPFILVTGTLGDELAVECIKRGATDYVLKEKLDRLPLAVRRALQEQRVREERDRAERELVRQVEQFRSVVNGAPYGIYRADSEGNILMANPALVAMLGYGSEEEVRRLNSVRDIFLDRRAREQALTQIQNEKGSAAEHRWRRKDTKEIVVRLAGRKLENSGSSPIFEVFAEDITAQRNLEQQFLQAQKMEAVGRLAGGVAHDFNNLLMIISSCLELWQHEKADSEKAAKYVRQIREATSMAGFVVRQLLTFSRKQMMERQVVDLNAVLKDLSKMLPRLLGEDIEVVVAPGSDLPKIEVDRGNIEQVVMNLAVNARDAMPAGGKLAISTAGVNFGRVDGDAMKLDPGHYVKLSISDTGMGMDEETQKRIFEPFFTTKEQGKGTGLGLATVSSIVKQNAGGIFVHSRIGQGTNFELYFPAAGARKLITETPKPVRPAERGTETVLVVEDEAALRAITTEYLESQGYTVLAAGNGVVALDICRNHPGPIHLLLTDVVMPGLSGPEVAQAAVAMRPEMRVIYVSGYIDRQIDLAAVGASTTFLQKPYGLVDLNRKIRGALAGESRLTA